jgi:hypothetical protein
MHRGRADGSRVAECLCSLRVDPAPLHRAAAGERAIQADEREASAPAPASRLLSSEAGGRRDARDHTATELARCAVTTMVMAVIPRPRHASVGDAQTAVFAATAAERGERVAAGAVQGRRRRCAVLRLDGRSQARTRELLLERSVGGARSAGLWLQGVLRGLCEWCDRAGHDPFRHVVGTPGAGTSSVRVDVHPVGLERTEPMSGAGTPRDQRGSAVRRTGSAPRARRCSSRGCPPGPWRGRRSRTPCRSAARVS